MSPLASSARTLVLWLSLALVLTGAAPAARQPPPAALEALEADALGADAPRFYRADISKDGVADWIADFSERLAWCGSGGCRTVILISRPDGRYAAAFDEQTQSFRLRRRHGKAVLDVDVYGAWCGYAGVASCWRRFIWSEPEGRFSETANRHGKTLLHGPLFQVVPVQPPPGLDLGPCQPKAASVPDLDGDGRRDLVVQSEGCRSAGEEQTRVWITAGGGGFAIAWPGLAYELDVGSRPAVLRAPAAACPQLDPCPLTPLVWDVSARRFNSVAR